MTTLISEPASETGVSAAVVAASADVQRTIWSHRWVAALAGGTLPEHAFLNWAGQCRLFCQLERSALLTVRSYIAPGELDDCLTELVADTVREPRELAQLLVSAGAQIPEDPSPACLGYGSYVQAQAHRGLLPGLAAIFAVERIYLETWSGLVSSCAPDSRYRHWVDNWTSEGFRTVVAGLADGLDRLAFGLPAETHGMIATVYRHVALWELDFWEMCWSGQEWHMGNAR